MAFRLQLAKEIEMAANEGTSGTGTPLQQAMRKVDEAAHRGTDALNSLQRILWYRAHALAAQFAEETRRMVCGLESTNGVSDIQFRIEVEQALGRYLETKRTGPDGVRTYIGELAVSTANEIGEPPPQPAPGAER